MDAKAIHDRLLELQPEGATHQMEDCQHCLRDALDEGATSGGGTQVTTYSQEELDRAVAAATAEADARAAAAETAKAGSELDAKVAEAVATKEAEIAALKAEVDRVTVEAGKEKADREALEAWLVAEADAATAKAEADARKDTRLAEVAQLQVPFTAEQIAAKADGWAALTDAEWDARKAEWAEITGRTPPAPTPTTGLGGFRETADLHTRQGGSPSTARQIGDTLRDLRSSGIDPRTIH